MAGLFCAPRVHAAFISEIDLDSPAGRAVEVSQMQPGSDYTLVVMEANPFSTALFGTVLGVVPLADGLGSGGVAMVSDSAWPGGAVPTVPLASLSPASATATLNLSYKRLLVLLRGQVGVNLLDRPVTQASAYDSAAVEDWLVMGDGLTGQAYVSGGHDIGQINTALGIDLLARVVDTNAGSVIGRSWLAGEDYDLSLCHVGEPNEANQFDAALDGYLYTYTPGVSNLPLLAKPTALPGDTDGDGDVDDSDLGNAFANYTGPVGAAGGKAGAQGDTDSDGDVDDSDLGSAFSAYTGPLSPGSAVPEPASLCAAVLGLAVLGLRGRRDCFASGTGL